MVMYRIRRRWTVREVDLPSDLLLSRRRLLRWFALSIGLINENDSREGILDVLDALLTFWFVRKRNPTFDDLKELVARRYVERGKKSPTDEALRKHLRKLLSIGLVRREGRTYVLDVDPLRPEDPASAIDHLFERICRLRDLVRAGFSHLRSLYER